MALSFPLSPAQFIDLLPLQSMTMDCPEQVEASQTGGGEMLVADLGPRLWQGKVTLGRMTRAEAQWAETMIDLLRGAGRSFLLHDRRRAAPLLDPAGAALGASAVTLLSLAAGNREVRLAGLPVGYRLSVGDHLGFAYGANPLRHALHRVVTTLVTAAGDGTTPTFEVTPPIRPGAATGVPVALVRPVCKVQLLPGSVEMGSTRGTITEGIAFQFRQTLR